MQAVQIFLDATIDGLSETALDLDKTKGVFHFAAYRRFLPLDLQIVQLFLDVLDR